MLLPVAVRGMLARLYLGDIAENSCMCCGPGMAHQPRVAVADSCSSRALSTPILTFRRWRHPAVMVRSASGYAFPHHGRPIAIKEVPQRLTFDKLEACEQPRPLGVKGSFFRRARGRHRGWSDSISDLSSRTID